VEYAADLHIAQDFGFRTRATHHTITLSMDVINLTNLLNKDWGWVYFSSNTYNSTESIGLLPYTPARYSGGYPIYTFSDPGKPYSVDQFNSRYQIQLGVRYSF